MEQYRTNVEQPGTTKKIFKIEKWGAKFIQVERDGKRDGGNDEKADEGRIEGGDEGDEGCKEVKGRG